MRAQKAALSAAPLAAARAEAGNVVGGGDMWITYSAAGAGGALLSQSGRLACFAGGNGDGLQAEHLTPAPADTGREARLTGDGHTPRWSTAAAEPLRIARKPARDRPDRL
jgi:hypothetical protein